MPQSAAVSNTATVALKLPTLKLAMKVKHLEPKWGKDRKIHSFCPYNADVQHSPGDPETKLKTWLQDGQIVAQCDDCGIIPNFAELIGLKPTQPEPELICLQDIPTVEPEPELICLQDIPSFEIEPEQVEPVEPEPEPVEPVEPEPVKPEPERTTFTFGAEFCQQPPKSNSIIRGMLDYDSLSYCWGDSEAGKSFLMLDRDLHIANGMKWCGRKTKQGLVLYIAGEGKHGLIKRVKAWHDYYGLPVSNNIAFRTIPTALCDPKAVGDLVDEIKSIIATINRRPTLIELDTVNRNFGPGDENSTKDMTAFVAGMDSLRIATGAAISAVHHCGNGDKTRSRGSIVLHNSVDFEYRVSKEGTCFNEYVTSLEFAKVKDYDKPKPLSWKWHLQQLPWADEDDEGNAVPMNSVVFIPTEYDNKNSTALSKVEKIAIESLRNALVEFGIESDGIVSVSEDDWRQAAFDLGITKATSYDAKRMAFNRAKNTLCDKCAVSHHVGRYWIPANRTNRT